MAFTKRKFDSVKLVLATDPAIDATACDWAKYYDAGCDWSLLKFNPGEEPTVFVCKPMTYAQRERLRQLDGFEKDMFAFRCGIEAIENYQIDDQSGAIVGQVPQVEFENHPKYGRMASEPWFRKAELPDFQVSFAATTIYRMSEALFPLSRRFVAPTGDGGR